MLNILASTYIPIDRRLALAQGEPLPDRNRGAVLFADISGFTPLTTFLLKELGFKRGPEELTRQLNLVYEALVVEVHRYGGSILGFAGDAITCWFDSDDGTRALACALAMQQAMARFAQVKTPRGSLVSLGMKVAVAVGPVRRFVVGDPAIQLIDVLAGATLGRMAAAEHLANRGEVVLALEETAALATLLEVTEFRADPESGQQVAVIAGLAQEVSPRPWPASERELDEIRLRAWVLPPVYQRLQSGQGQFLAEIRPVAPLFVRFDGINYETDRLAGQKLDKYIRWVQHVLAQYDAFLLQLTLGDKGCYLYAAFGAPVAHDNDPARAVATALALQAPPIELNFVSNIQIGISRGRAWSGAYGGLARHTYGVLGDAVNTAARLMSWARPGQIIIDQNLARAVASEYLLQDLGPIQVKGKEEPFPVALVLGRHQQTASRPIERFATPLVGRESELARLEALLGGSPTGAGQILRLQGPTGIGKSHLITEFSEHARQQGWQVVLGACQSTSQGIPYYPWRQIFRVFFALPGEHTEATESESTHQLAQVIAKVTQLNPAWLLRLPLLNDLLGLPIPDNPTTAAFSSQLRQEALFTLAVDLTQRWAQAQPLLLLLDDVHWLDEASRELTMALARVVTLTSTPVLLVVAHRLAPDERRAILPGLAELPNYHRVELGELSPAGVATMLSHRLQGQPSLLLLSLIQLQARGNPFFVEELGEALREANHLIRQDDGSWMLHPALVATLRQAGCLVTHESGELMVRPDADLSKLNLGLPDSIYGLVLARLDRLLEAHKVTLKVASVIGRIFEFQLLTRAHPVETDPDDLLQQVEEFEERGFTRLETPLPHLAHIFRHNITRDVAYETLLEAQQRQLHRAVAEAMEALLPEAVEQLAYHYSRAGLRDKTLLYLDRAARQAQHKYTNETALLYYTQALALEERWEWRKGQIEVLHILGRREEELVALTRLAANPAVPIFELAYRLEQYYEAVADYPQAQMAIERALAASRVAQQPLNEMRCLAQLGLLGYKQGAYDQAKTRYQQALALYPETEELKTEETREIIQVLNGLGITCRQQGEFHQAREYHLQALTLSHQISHRQGEAQVFNDLGVMAFYQRHLTEALAYHRQALEIRRTIGDRPGEGTSLYNLAMVTRDAHNYGQAQEYLSAALNILQATGNRWDELNVWNELGILYQELGDLRQAQTCLERAREISQNIGDEGGRIYILGNLGLVMRDLEAFAAAENWLTEGLTLAQQQADTYVVSLFLSHLAIVSLLNRQPELAIERAKQALRLRRELDLLLWTTADLATLAAAHQSRGEALIALDYAGQALAILDGCGGEGPEAPQRDYFVCFQVFDTNGHSEPAQTALQAAHSLVMRRAEKILDPALRQSFLEQVQLNREIIRAYEQQA